MAGDEAARLEGAILAVAGAMRVCRRVQAAAVGALLKEDRSPVTVADLASQAYLAHALERELSMWPLVAEEDSRPLRQGAGAATLAAVREALGEAWPGASEAALLEAVDRGQGAPSQAGFWTLDPVDGTKGFLRGEQYAISLAFVQNGQVTLGVLGCPNLSFEPGRPFDQPDALGSLYVAVRGAGAEQRRGDGSRGHPLSRADHPALEGLRLCESVEAAHSKHDDTKRVMETLGARGPSARLDSQAKYAVVARGEADLYLRLPTRKGYVERIWDHAAGSLIATEAGLAVSDARGQPLDFGQGRGLEKNSGVVVAPRAVHAEVLAAVARLGGGAG